MSRLENALRSARGPVAAIVCASAACATFAGCLDTVSLGSGVGDGGSGGTGHERPRLRFSPVVTGPDEEVTVGGIQCQPSLTTDLDGDGWTPAQGDCNDCDPDQGPSAIEMPTPSGGTPLDEDCDGEIDEPNSVCDAGLPVDGADALDAARAIDLCQVADSGRWGVVKAAWVLPDGSAPPETEAFALGHGFLDRFGANVAVRHGKRMLALSSGTARQPGEADYVDPRGYEKGYSTKAPDGFPKPSPGCPGVHSGVPYDSVGLEIIVRAPQNAEAFEFDFDFYTFEFPDHTCSLYNDLFAALLSAQPGQPFENVSFDGAGNTICVNSVFLEACSCVGGPPCLVGGHEHECTLGAAPLVGTGFGADTSIFGDRGATGWLTTAAPVERGGTLTLRFAIHDAGDARFDSTVLIDNFRWRRMGTQIARTFRAL